MFPPGSCSAVVVRAGDPLFVCESPPDCDCQSHLQLVKAQRVSFLSLTVLLQVFTVKQTHNVDNQSTSSAELDHTDLNAPCLVIS